MKAIIKNYLMISLTFSFASISVFAQPAGGDNNIGEDINDTYVPIDGGIISVTGLAIAYGMKRRKKKRNVNMP